MATIKSTRFAFFFFFNKIFWSKQEADGLFSLCCKSDWKADCCGNDLFTSLAQERNYCAAQQKEPFSQIGQTHFYVAMHSLLERQVKPVWLMDNRVSVWIGSPKIILKPQKLLSSISVYVQYVYTCGGSRPSYRLTSYIQTFHSNINKYWGHWTCCSTRACNCVY